jgi:hypothetical protein
MEPENKVTVVVDSGLDIESLDLYLIRGRDVAPQLHEALVEYSHFLKAIVCGEIQLEDLVQRIPEFSTALAMEYAQQNRRIPVKF